MTLVVHTLHVRFKRVGRSLYAATFTPTETGLTRIVPIETMPPRRGPNAHGRPNKAARNPLPVTPSPTRRVR